MKLKLLVLTILVSMLENSAMAYVTVEQTTDPQHVKNSGYSAITADTISVSKARAAGEEFYTEKEINYRKRTPVTRFFWRLYQYTDPAAEDYSFFHHDTKTPPVQTDL